MKHIAHLSTGGTVEIELPLHPVVTPALPDTWRGDQNGTLINLAYVTSIVGAPAKKLVKLVDSEGSTWYAYPERGEGFFTLWPDTTDAYRNGVPGWRRETIRDTYGIREEIWE